MNVVNGLVAGKYTSFQAEEPYIYPRDGPGKG